MRSWTISIGTDSRVPGMARGSARLCWIKSMSLGIAACLWCFLSTPTPAQDASARSERDRLVAFFAERFPSVPLDDYIYGALIGNPGGRRQYDEIMELPPFLGDLEAGKKIWETPFRNGKTFGDCFPNRGRNVVGHYPYYDDKLGRVVTFENALNACLTANNEAPLAYGARVPMGVLEAYARSLSDGQRIDVKLETPGAKAKYEAGKALFYRRIGQLNASCAGCHVYNAGRIMRMEVLSPVLGHATHWPIFRGGEELMTFQGRFKRCMEQMRAAPFGFDSEEWNNLEFYLSYLSNGLPLKSSVFRK
jgi:L-cysteine S-thiosulfotransferase